MLYKSSKHFTSYLEKLGLIEREIKIYTLLVESCPLSPGEIQQSLSNVELLEVVVSLRNMKNLGIIGSTEGGLSRFYAKFLFLLEAIDIEKETIFNLNTLVKSTEESHRMFQVKEKTIKKKLSDKLAVPLFEIWDDKFQENKSKSLSLISNLHTKAQNLLDEIFRKSSDGMKSLFLETSEKAIKALKAREQKLNESLEIFQKNFAERIATNEKNNFNLVLQEDKDSQNRIEKLMETVLGIESNIRSIQDTVLETQNLSKSTESKHLRLITDIHKYQQAVNEFKVGFDLKLAEINKNANRITDELNKSKKVNRDEVLNLISSTVEMSNLPVHNLVHNFRKLDEKVDINPQFSLIISKLEDITISKLSFIKDKISKQKFGAQADLLKDSIVQQFKEFKGTTSKEVEQLLNENRKIFSVNDTQVGKYHNASIDKIEELLLEIKKRKNTILSTFEKVIMILEKEQKAIPQEERKMLFEKSVSQMYSIINELVELDSKKNSLLKDEVRLLAKTMEGRAHNIKQIVNAAHNFKAKLPINTGIVYGEFTILASLNDLIIRSRNKVIIIIPKFDEALFNLVATLNTHVRISLITKYPHKHVKKIISAAQEIGTITLFDYQAGDIFAGFKDNDEIIFGFNSELEEKNAVRSTEELMIKLFTNELNQITTRQATRLN